MVVLVVLVAVRNFAMFKIPYTPVTPNGDFTATFVDFKFGLVASDRCVVAFNRHLAVTPKHRSQQIAAFLHNLKRQSPDCAETVQRVHWTVQRLKEIVCDLS